MENHLFEGIFEVFNVVLYRKSSNLTLLFFNVLCVISFIYLSIAQKEIFNFAHRVGFLFMASGLIHNILQRLEANETLDSFYLINIPSSFGYILVQIGIIIIMLSFVTRGLAKFLFKRK